MYHGKKSGRREPRKKRKFGKRWYFLVWDSKDFDKGFENRDTKRGVAERKRVGKLYEQDERADGDYYLVYAGEIMPLLYFGHQTMMLHKIA